MAELANIRKEISRLKNPIGTEIPRIEVSVDGKVISYLRAIPSSPADRLAADAELMAQWRNLRKEAFFTWFTATPESTAAWLAKNYIGRDDDIIFIVESPDGQPYGHLSLYNFSADGTTCEYGRVLRGPDGGPKGGMTAASRQLLAWGKETLGVERIFLEVFKDNAPATAMYERCGFHTVQTIPLRRIDEGSRINWVKIEHDSGKSQPAPDSYALRMEFM